MTVEQAQIRPFGNDEQILRCVDQGLDSVGQNVKEMVYWHLKRIEHVSRMDIPQKPTMFVQGLRAIYHASSPAVETAIVMQLNKRFALNCPLGSDLVTTIIQAKSKSVA